MSLRIFLDLDRTLYRTDLGTRLIWQEIARSFSGVNDAHELARQDEFYVHDGDSYAYDIGAHLAMLGLDTDEVFEHVRRSEIADGRLEYEGVDELVTWARSVGEVKILTYGHDDYQRLKASLCPSIAGVEVVTTLGSKGDYLNGVEGRVWLVDDKPIGDELPEYVRFVQVTHGPGVSGASADSSLDWPRASSLREAQQILARD